MAKYRFIHLSDIHFGQERNDGSIAIHDDIRKQLLHNCSIMRRDLGQAHGILLTGDTVYSGKEEEFKRIAEWLEELTSVVGCQKIAVYVVPGNHDVDLDQIKRLAKLLQGKLSEGELCNLDADLEAIFDEDEHSNPMLPKFIAYRRFAEEFGCDFGSLQKPMWEKTCEMKNSNRLKFIGLNSALISDGKDKKGSLILGSKQYVIPVENSCEFVVLVHHPIHWFRDGEKAAPYFRRARVIMVGHEHNLEIEKKTYEDGTEQLLISAGATNPPEMDGSYQYRYNWIEFDHSSTGNKEELLVKVFPQLWNSSLTKFVPDTARLGGYGSREFSIACPNFVSDVSSVPVRTTSQMTNTVCKDGEPENRLPQEDSKMIADSEAEKFGKLRYYFWRYLDWSDRLKILVRLDLLPASLNQPVPQTLEKLALEKARKIGKLKELWSAIMEIIPEDRREENPF